MKPQATSSVLRAAALFQSATAFSAERQFPCFRLNKYIRGYSSSVERQLPKLHRRVRLPLSAPKKKDDLRVAFISFPRIRESNSKSGSPVDCRASSPSHDATLIFANGKNANDSLYPLQEEGHPSRVPLFFFRKRPLTFYTDFGIGICESIQKPCKRLKVCGNSIIIVLSEVSV